MVFVGYVDPAARSAGARRRKPPRRARSRRETERRNPGSRSRSQLKTPEIELCLGKQLSTHSARVARRAGAPGRARCGANSPSNTDSSFRKSSSATIIGDPAKTYQIKIHGTIVARDRAADRRRSGHHRRGPPARRSRRRGAGAGLRHEGACGSRRASPASSSARVQPIDNMSVVLTHLSEVIRNNLAQLLSYRDMRAAARSARSGIQATDRRDHSLADLLFGSPGRSQAAAGRARLDPQPASHPRGDRRGGAACRGAPSRLPSTCACAWRSRSAAILPRAATLKVLRLGNRWDLAFHQA